MKIGWYVFVYTVINNNSMLDDISKITVVFIILALCLKTAHFIIIYGVVIICIGLFK